MCKDLCSTATCKISHLALVGWEFYMTLFPRPQSDNSREAKMLIFAERAKRGNDGCYSVTPSRGLCSPMTSLRGQLPNGNILSPLPLLSPLGTQRPLPPPFWGGRRLHWPLCQTLADCIPRAA